MRRLAARLGRFGVWPEDDERTRLCQRMLLIGSLVFGVPIQVAIGALALRYGDMLMATIVLVSAMFATVVSLLLGWVRRGRPVYQGLLLLPAVITPGLCALLTGGLLGTAYALAWGLVAALLAAILWPPLWAVRFFLFYLLVLAACWIGEPWLSRPNHIPPELARMIGYLSAAGLSCVSFATLLLALTERNRAYLEAQSRRERADSLLAELETSHQSLVEADRFKTEFFQNITHEFRTPLTLILGPVASALDGRFGELNAELASNLGAVARNARRLKRLIDQLLELSRIDAGQLRLQRQWIDLGAFVRWIAAPFESGALQRDLKMTIDVPEDAVLCEVDVDKLEMVAANLLGNALKFTAPGDKVLVSLAADESEARIAVHDTGCGIPSDKLPLIFERFRQVDGSANRRYEGSGIGLALAKELVALHGGQLEVVSQLGIGSTFTVRLPRRASPDQEPAQVGESPLALTESFKVVAKAAGRARPSPRLANSAPTAASFTAAPPATAPDMAPSLATTNVPPATPQLGAGERVLVVEDNDDLRNLLAESLRSAGFDVSTAANGQLAWQLASQSPPDLIVSDLMMPQMNGLELLTLCRNDPSTRHVPFLVLSAQTSQASLLESLRQGANDYLPKPFLTEELLVRVNRLLDLGRLTAQNLELRVELMGRRLRPYRQRLPWLASELATLEQILPLDIPSALNKIRFVMEMALHQLARQHGVTWGDAEPTLERLIGPLIAARILPKDVAVHVRTLQTNTSPGSHFQEHSLAASHVAIAAEALCQFLEWLSQGPLAAA